MYFTYHKNKVGNVSMFKSVPIPVPKVKYIISHVIILTLFYNSISKEILHFRGM